MTEVPSWGRVHARPHECLLLIRNGEVRAQQQGGSLFKWPSDTVARVDTSIHRLQFTADQITREKTGVAVKGLAVVRIVEPLLAYRMLNLGADGAWTAILEEMFVGATRRLVANLTLEDCLTRRKDALATELMAEVAPVVSGSGRVEDSTHAGWGVAIDTIEIQDVRVLSDEVFDRLQAPYREKLALEALAAQDEVRREEAKLAAEAARSREERRRALMAIEENRLEAERERSRHAADHRAQVAMTDTEAAQARAEAEARTAVKVAELEAEAALTRGRAEADVTRLAREAAAEVSEDRLREIALTETLPKVAEAFAGAFDHAVVTGGDMSFLSAGVAQVFATMDAFGVKLPGQEE